MDAYWALARRAAAEGTRLPVQDGSALIRWAPQNQHPLTLPPPAGRGESGWAYPGPQPTGPEIWAQVSPTGEVIGATPVFSTGPGDTYRLPLDSFASTAHAGIDNAVDFAEATALASGRIAQARLLINPVSEVPYWWMQVALRNATLHVFADRETLGKEPQAGNILWASFWLVGKMAGPGDQGTK